MRMNLCSKSLNTLTSTTPPSQACGLGLHQKHHTDFSCYRYKVGDTFYTIPLSEATSLLSTSTEEVSTDITKLEEQVSGIREEMESLKAHLYARFGRGINLEA
jgi:chaperonin cofactor prefoldin